MHRSGLIATPAEVHQLPGEPQYRLSPGDEMDRRAILCTSFKENGTAIWGKVHKSIDGKEHLRTGTGSKYHAAARPHKCTNVSGVLQTFNNFIQTRFPKMEIPPRRQGWEFNSVRSLKRSSEHPAS